MTTELYKKGNDALADLYASNEGNNKSFTSLAKGNAYKVRALGITDFITFRSYGIFKVINSFTPEKLPVLNAKGFPVENLTPWDKASDYYVKKMFDEKDEAKKKALGEQAAIYRGKQRFAMGFIDLETGEPVVFDLSKNQALAVHAVLKKNATKLDKKAFEIEKSGSGNSTTVLLSPIDLDELTPKEQENFAKYDGKEYDSENFDGLIFIANEETQKQSLVQAGFDLSLIGLATNGTTTGENEEQGHDF